MSKLHIIEEPTYKGGTEIRVAYLQAEEPEAHLAIELMRQLAIVAAETDGEDKTGRQKLRLLKPDEVAIRACEIAAEAYKEFQARGWLKDLPAPKQSRPDEDFAERSAERAARMARRLQGTETAGETATPPASDAPGAA